MPLGVSNKLKRYPEAYTHTLGCHEWVEFENCENEKVSDTDTKGYLSWTKAAISYKVG